MRDTTTIAGTTTDTSEQSHTQESIVDDQYTEEQLKEIRSDPEKLRLVR